MKSIVVVDESPSIRETLAIVLGRDHHVATAATIDAIPAAETPALLILGLPPAAREATVLDAALAAVDERVPLLLLNRPGLAGRERLRRSQRSFSVVPKPFELHALQTAVARALAAPPRDATPPPAGDVPQRYLEYPYVARECALLAARAIATDLPVLVIGEAGTGAADVARALHGLRGRGGPFVVRSAGDLDARALGVLHGQAAAGTLFVDDVQAASHETQHALLALLRARHETGGGTVPDVVAATAAPLDAAVASGAFLADLAYALGALVLRLTPLRDRAEDVPALVERESTEVARRLGLEPVTYTAAALTRLTQYLWFGNVAELSAVVARTLAMRRPLVVDASDLLFDSRDVDPSVESAGASAGRPRAAGGGEERVVLGGRALDLPPGPNGDDRRPPVRAGSPQPAGAGSERRPRALHAIPAAGTTARGAETPAAERTAESPALEVLVGELAHELRNPMVTIKTFAQHLDSVLADPEVRARFSALAGEAITRMDALLENLLDFARFRAPHRQAVDLAAVMDRALAEFGDELGRKSVRIERSTGTASPVDADEAQLLFAFRSLLAGLLPDLLPHEPLRVSAPAPAALAMSALADRTVAHRLAQLVGDDAGDTDGQPLPLAFALAAALIRRNGGALRTALEQDGRTSITIEWPARQPQEGS